MLSNSAISIATTCLLWKNYCRL